MNNNRVVPIQRDLTTSPRCTCCQQPQVLVVTGRGAYCPLTEKMYEEAADGNFVRLIADDTPAPGAFHRDIPEWQGDFYPGRARRRGEAAPLAINPAEERFGA